MKCQTVERWHCLPDREETMLTIHLCGMSIYLIEQQGEIIPSLGNNYSTKGNSFGTIRQGVCMCVCVCVKLAGEQICPTDFRSRWLHWKLMSLCTWQVPKLFGTDGFSHPWSYYFMSLLPSQIVLHEWEVIFWSAYLENSSRVSKTLPSIHLNRNWAHFPLVTWDPKQVWLVYYRCFSLDVEGFLEWLFGVNGKEKV